MGGAGTVQVAVVLAEAPQVGLGGEEAVDVLRGDGDGARAGRRPDTGGQLQKQTLHGGDQVLATMP